MPTTCPPTGSRGQCRLDDRRVHPGVSVIPFTWNVFKSWRYGEPVTVDDPWGYGNSLEGRPVARRGANFTELPRIRFRSGPHSSCTTRTSWSGCARRGVVGRDHHPAEPSRWTNQLMVHGVVDPQRSTARFHVVA